MHKSLLNFLIAALLINMAFFSAAQMSAQDTDDLMDMSIEDIMNMEITTAGKQAQKISEIPASVQVITREDIRVYGYRDIQELIENTLGMYLTDEKSMFDVGINVRGFWSSIPSNIIILINGVSQVDDRYNTYTIRSLGIPLEAIERVEIVRGPLSVIYGSGSFFGAINIITKSNSNQAIVQAEYCSFDTKQIMANGNISKDDFNLSITGAYEKGNGDKFEFNKAIADFTTVPHLKDAEIKNGFAHERKYFNINASSKNLYGQLSLVDYEDGFQLITAPGPNNVPMVKGTQTIASIGLKNEVNDWLSYDAMLTYNSSVTFRSDFYHAQSNSAFYGYIEDKSKSINGDLLFFLNPMKELDLTVGFNIKDVMQNSSLTDVPLVMQPNQIARQADSTDLIRYAAYVQGSYKINEQMTVLAGLRLEQESNYDVLFHSNQGTPQSVYVKKEVPKSDMMLIPRAAFIYSIDNSNVIKFMYGKAAKLPNAQQNMDILMSIIQTQKEQAFLKSEEINTFELNYQGNLTPTIQANASFFYNTMKNLIVRQFVITGTTVGYSINNTGNLSTIGGELSLIMRPFDRFKAEVSAMYQSTKDNDNKDIDVSHSPNFLGYLKLNYDFFAAKADEFNVSVGLTGNYVGKMLATLKPTQTDLTARMGKETDPYFLLGANIRFENLGVNGLFATLKGSNLLNSDYRTPTSPNADWAYYGMPGRSIYMQFGVGYRFGLE